MPDSTNIERLHHDGLADYHCHCDYSVDAKGTIDEYCQAALRRGLAEICFTTHYDITPDMTSDEAVIRVKGELKPATPENLTPYVDDIRAAREKYLPLGLLVRPGLEFGWYRGCEEEVQRMQEMHGFEYMLCGIHELDGQCFACSGCYEKAFGRFSVEEAVERYVEQVVTAARSGLFNTIAHLDYIRKYGTSYYGEKLDELLFEKAGEVIFDALRESDTCLEVNTSSMRRGFNDYFPRIKLINAARRAGVDVHYLGSDAHRPEDVGSDFDAAAPLATMATNAWCEDRD